MIRPLCLCLALLGLAGCYGTPPPQSVGGPVYYGEGVGFGSYRDYEAQRLERERALAGYGPPQGTPPGPAGADSGAAISSDELRAAGIPAGSQGTGSGAGLPAAEPVPTRSIDDAFDASRGQGPDAQAEPVQRRAPVDVNNPGISDEQSFAAVSSRESIESDAARLERQRAAYRVVEPQAVPQRTGRAGPNIVQYALATSNPVGQPVYSRGGLFAERKFRAACAKFASPDLAQQSFLREGGPERDPLGVDPDGDGFACSWDPAPFRAAKG